MANVNTEHHDNPNQAWWLKQAGRAAWVVVVIGISGFIFQQATRDDVLPVKEIAVSGVFKELEMAELKEQIADGVEGNFFTLSVSSLYTKLLSLSWVEQVWIHRVWPDKIKIDLLEQVPVAIWNNSGLINANGELFHNDVTGFENRLPRFNVEARYKHEVIEWNKKYHEILEGSELSVKIFELDDRKNQKLFLSNGIKLFLGRVETAQRLTRFLAVYENNLYREESRISKVDLRYSNGFSVAWK